MIQAPQNKMQYRTLGKTSLKVSVLSFGTWLNADDPESIARNKQIVKHAWDLGINFFDTAEGYGGGQAEVQLGVALKELQAEKNVNREDLVVSTKLFMGAHFFKGPNSGESIAPNTRFLSRKHIIEGTKASLERLQLDYVDLLYCHRFDHITPLEETCRAMDWVVRKGYALYWGTSEWTAQQIFQAHGICERLNLLKPVVEQPQYNLFVRERFEVEYERVFDKLQLGSTVWSPLAQGILTGKYNESLGAEGRLTALADNPALRSVMQRFFATEETKAQTQDKLKRLGEIAKELGATQAQFSLAWVLKNKDVSTAITSASKPEQLDDSLNAVELISKITPEIEKRVEEILKNKPVGTLTFTGPAPTRRDKYV